jgi:hypothetical protein
MSTKKKKTKKNSKKVKLLARLNLIDTGSALAKATGKWTMMVSFNNSISDGERNWNPAEYNRSCPYLDLIDVDFQLFCDGVGFLQFETYKDMTKAFWQTIGDDGPNKHNRYKGPLRTYALTFDPSGQALNENT